MAHPARRLLPIIGLAGAIIIQDVTPLQGTGTCRLVETGELLSAIDIQQDATLRVARILPVPIDLTSFPESGISDDGSDLTVDREGNAYLLFIHSPPQGQDPVILKVSPGGQLRQSIAASGSPDAIAVGPGDALFAVDIDEDTSIEITRLLPNPAPVAFVTTESVSEDAVDFVIDRAGNYYLLAGNGRIRRFGPSGAALPDLPATGSPDAIAVGPGDSVYAVDIAQNRFARIERIAPDRLEIASFNDDGISDDGVSLVVDSAGNPYLLFIHSPPQAGDPVLRRFTPDGACSEDLTVIGTPETLGIRHGCTGDCNDDGIVTVNELIRGVGIVLERRELTLSSCPVLDVNGDGRAEVNELVTGVGRLLSGCP